MLLFSFAAIKYKITGQRSDISGFAIIIAKENKVIKIIRYKNKSICLVNALGAKEQPSGWLMSPNQLYYMLFS